MPVTTEVVTGFILTEYKNNSALNNLNRENKCMDIDQKFEE